MYRIVSRVLPVEIAVGVEPSGVLCGLTEDIILA